MVYEIRKMDPNLCPKKPKRKREDIVRVTLKMISAVDELTDKQTLTPRANMPKHILRLI